MAGYFFILLLLPVVHSYLFGCYYDYGQPLVLSEQLPTDICTHVLLIGAVFVQNRNVSIAQRSYNGSKALQSMRDYRARHTQKLKVIPSLIGGDDEWKQAINDTDSQMKFTDALVAFAQAEVRIDSSEEISQTEGHCNRILMVLILIGNILVVIINLSLLNLLFDFVWLLIKLLVLNSF